ncbi:MAG: hypothetical protein ACRCZ5_13485 [Burkholderiales bacterium]
MVIRTGAAVERFKPGDTGF